MREGYLNIATIKPWWFRLAFLLAVGSPMLTSGSLHGKLHQGHFFRDLGGWTAYAVFVWAIIFLAVGLDRLLDWLAAGFYFAFTLALTGALFRKLGVWENLEMALLGTTTDPLVALMGLVFKFMVVLVACPFAFLVVNSFPAGDIVKWISRRSSSKKSRIMLSVAIFLRMLQHVAEVVSRSMVAWREENPAIIIPRFRADWQGSVFKKFRFVEWAWITIYVWSVSVAIHSLQAVPSIVRDFRRASEANKGA